MYICNAGNGGDQPATEAYLFYLCDDAKHFYPLVNTITGGFLFYVKLKFFIMNKEFLIGNLQEFNAYLIDILHNGLEGVPLNTFEREVYKMAITSVYFLIDFLER